MTHNMVLFSGNSNKNLAENIARQLRIHMGEMIVSQFSDGETRVEVQDNVRGKDVYIVQSTNSPANHNIMELLIMVDAVKRSAPDSITVIIPYYGYSRQDRRPGFSRVPITSRLVANLLDAAGVDQVVTIELHAQQIQGFFSTPIINATASHIITNDIERRYLGDDTIIVSPDVGGVARARALAKLIGKGDMDLAIIDKRRPEANVSEVMNLIGDVDGKVCIMIDDIIDTAGTLCKAAAALKDHGAKKVVAYATHAVLSGNALENISNSVLEELVVTDTISHSTKVVSNKRIRRLPTARMLAETIRRIHSKDSVSQLYE